MAFPAHQYITPEEYLAIEVRATEKHEYFDGRIYDMAGNSFDHILIVSTLQKRLNIFLDGKPCDTFGSDLRITTPDLASFMYPDLTIVCDEMQTLDKGHGTLLNPTVIIEVLSPSTRGYDLAFKFHYYKQIPSLQEYILIDSTRVFTQRNIRTGKTWRTEESDNIGDGLRIESIQFDVPLQELYQRISFSKL